MEELRARWSTSLEEFPEASWQQLLRASAQSGSAAVSPFFQWRWLHHLESSGSIAPRQGWPLRPEALETLQRLGGELELLPLAIPASASSRNGMK